MYNHDKMFLFKQGIQKSINLAMVKVADVTSPNYFFAWQL